jgi:NADH dehydrogenase
MAEKPKVIIIGAGFGGLFAARQLAGQQVEVLLIDRQNYHTFTPLIYQVATCALDPSEVAYPVRSIFYTEDNIRFLLGTVTAIDPQSRQVRVQVNGHSRQEAYDYLIVAAGSSPSYFGRDEFREHSFEMRTLSDSVKLRNHILRLFEKAAWESDYSQRDALTTLVVVGGGPTGLETAGAIYELYNHVLRKEYKAQHLRARVILVERMGHLLNAYPDHLREAALEQLKSLGVEVMLGRALAEVAEDHISLDDGTRIPTHTLIWSAGIKGSPIAGLLGVDLRPNGTIPVKPSLEVTGLERIYAVGDISYLPNAEGQAHAQVIPVAIQQGGLAAKNILAAIAGQEATEFNYKDRGSMATIGRRRAVVWLYNRYAMRGYLAWAFWLALHLVSLMGFRNRASVFVSWVWNYFTYDRSVRIILERQPHEGPLEAPAKA